MGNPPKIAKRILRFWIHRTLQRMSWDFLSIWLKSIYGLTFRLTWGFLSDVFHTSLDCGSSEPCKTPVNHHPGTPMLIALQQFWLKPLPLVWPISTSWPATTRIGRDSDCVKSENGASTGYIYASMWFCMSFLIQIDDNHSNGFEATYRIDVEPSEDNVSLKWSIQILQYFLLGVVLVGWSLF